MASRSFFADQDDAADVPPDSGLVRRPCAVLEAVEGPLPSPRRGSGKPQRVERLDSAGGRGTSRERTARPPAAPRSSGCSRRRRGRIPRPAPTRRPSQPAGGTGDSRSGTASRGPSLAPPPSTLRPWSAPRPRRAGSGSRARPRARPGSGGRAAPWSGSRPGVRGRAGTRVGGRRSARRRAPSAPAGGVEEEDPERPARPAGPHRAGNLVVAVERPGLGGGGRRRQRRRGGQGGSSGGRETRGVRPPLGEAPRAGKAA